MTTAPLIGRSAYNAELARIRISHETFRRCLTQLVDDPGPQTRQVLIARMALALNDSQDALGNLERIGKQAKDLRAN